MSRRALSLGLVLLSSVCLTAARPERGKSDDVATPEELKARETLAQTFPGDIVFDSNRGNGFGIHVVKIGTGEILPLVDTDKEEMYPNVSPDGKWVAFSSANSQKKRSTSAIFRVPATGGEPEKLADDGTFPTYSADGKSVYFERDRNHIIELNLETKKETEIFPKGRAEWADISIVKPHVSPNGKFVSFISEKPRRWSSWYADLKTGEAVHVGPGCEPSWFSDNSKIAWVSGENAKERSGISAFDLKTKKVSVVQDADAPRGHEYFPTIEFSNRYLLYAAARKREHRPTTANYQLFVKDLKKGTVTRITFDPHTNRWPKLLRR